MHAVSFKYTEPILAVLHVGVGVHDAVAECQHVACSSGFPLWHVTFMQAAVSVN